MPGAGDVIVRDPDGLIVILTGPVVEFFGLLESVAVMVRFEVPATVGVPLTRQPVMVKPAGKVPPTTKQVYGAVPPVTPMGALYGTFTVPFGKVEIVSINAAEVIVILNDPLPVVPILSLAWTVNTYTPTVVGVPATMPPGDMVKPAGNAPEDTLKM